MDGTTPQSLLLDESIKLSNFVSYKTASEVELCDWTTVEKPSAVHLNSTEQLAKKMSGKRTEQNGNSLDNRNKGVRRFSPKINCNQSRERLHMKFEHFSNSSDFIEQYRNAKLLQLEKAFKKLLEDNSSRLSSDIRTRNVAKIPEKIPNCVDVSRPCSSETLSTKTGQLDRVSNPAQTGDLVKPCLPQSGYFTGKKWAYPKPVHIRPHRPYTEAKRSVGPRFCSKKSETQVFDPSNICLKGTGKPLNLSYNRTYTIPRRSACKSAPTTSQRTWTNLLSPRIKPQVVHTSGISKSQSQTNVSSSLGQELDANKLVHRNSYDHLSKVERTSEQDVVTNQQCLEYENMFHDVINYYKQPKQNSRSHFCVRIGT